MRFHKTQLFLESGRFCNIVTIHTHHDIVGDNLQSFLQGNAKALILFKPDDLIQIRGFRRHT